MIVTLIDYTGIQNIIRGALTCTANTDKIDNYYDFNTMTITDKGIKLVRSLITKGHESVMEHMVFVFEIKDMTRALLQQFMRHRHISPSIESTRWSLSKVMNNNASNFDDMMYIPDPSSFNFSDDQLTLVNNMNDMMHNYWLLLYKAMDMGIPNDFLKYYITENMYVTGQVTMNLREVVHILNLRANPPAMHEFNILSDKLFTSLPNDVKMVISEVVPSTLI